MARADIWLDLVPETQPDPNSMGARVKELSRLANQLVRGRNNASNEFTLQDSSTTTVVECQLVSRTSVVLWEPTTANAAAEIAAGGMYVSARSVGVSFTITHANNSETDRTFRYVILG